MVIWDMRNLKKMKMKNRRIGRIVYVNTKNDYEEF